MSANVETAVYANTPAWHGEGLVLDTNGEKGLTIETALPASGLDWEVEKVPVYTLIDGKPVQVKDRWGVERTTDQKCFGVVGNTWEPVQNAEGFAIIDDILHMAGQEHPTWIEAAGALNGGKKVWVLAHVDTGLQIAGEKYNSYILFTNGHDGRASVTAAMMDMRVVCSNTLAIGLYEAIESGRIVRVRHTTTAGDRIKEAADILNLRNVQLEQLAQQGEWLVEQEMSDDAFAKFLESLMPIKEEGTPAATMTGKRREAVANLYFDAPTCAPLKGTRWGAFQAAIEYADYGREFKSGDSHLKAQFGINQPNDIKTSALTILKDKRLRPLADIVG